MAITRTAFLGALAIALAPAGFATLPAAAAVQVFVDVAPPPPRHEVVPAPRRGYAWQPGYWHWRNGRHVWVEGHWVRARPGYYWHPSRWEQRNGRWAFNPGGWHRDRYVEYRPRRDRDRDGIPDRRDRDRDNDGVPNRFDARPDNPRRH